MKSSATIAVLTAFALFALALGSPLSAHAQNPAIVFSQTNGVTGIGSAPGTSEYNGTVGHIAANSRGDILANVSASGAAYVMEQPYSPVGFSNSSSTASATIFASQIALITGMQSNYGEHSLTVDSNNNIYVADQGQEDIIFIPFVNGAYPQNVVRNTIVNCSAFPVPAGQTTDCIVPLNYPGSLGYYVRAGDVGIDGSGNLYILAIYTGGSPQMYPNNDVLVQFSAATGNSTLISTSLSNDVNSQIAVNKAGDIFCENNGQVYFFSHTSYTSAPVQLTGLSSPDGVSADASGNVYITNPGAGDILEIPYLNGAYNVAAPYIVSNTLGNPYTGFTSAPSNGVAVDGFGNITYAGSYPNSISAVTPGGLAFGATTVATTSGASTLNLVFNSAETVASIVATGPFAVSSTVPTNETGCATQAYTVAAHCTVSVTFTPTAPGTQFGELIVYGAGQNVIGEAPLTGIGQAPSINVDPGTVSTDGTGYTAPSAVAVDTLGNVYTADSTTGTIYESTTGATTPATAIATGFKSPSAIAVDGDGNLYVGDAGNGQVVEVPYDAATSTYGTHIALATGLSGPSGLALDALGELYVADSGNARVLRLGSSGGQPDGSLITTFGTGFTTPVAVAVDNGGQFVYVSDAGAKQVVQIGIHTLVQADAITGLTTPAGLAVDAAGDVFAVDSGTASITRLPSINGSLNQNFETTLPSVVKLPTAIAVDNAGNLYVADTTDAIVATDNRTTGLLNLGSDNVGTTSNVDSAQVSDGGNASFSLSTPYYTESGSTGSFAIQASSTCMGGQTLTQGESCNLAANFTPQAPGPQTDTLTFASTAPNTATLVLSGTGVQLIASTLTLQLTSGASPTFGQPVTVQSTLTPASTGAAPPSGTITFYVDNVQQGSVMLTNDMASITFSGHTQLTGGTHSITASYSGDANYASANDNGAPLTVTVGQASTTTTVSITPSSPAYANPTSANPTQTVNIVADVIPPVQGTPTGTVNFYNGTTLLGTANVVAAQVNGANAGQATLSISTLAVGQYEVTATYSGDANYTSSTSTTPAPVLITNPTILMTASANSIIGGGAPITVTLTEVAGFNGAADFSCSNLPKYAACSFSPAYAAVAYGVPAAISFQVVIDQPPVIAVPAGIGAVPHLPGRGALAAFLALFLLLPSLLFGYARRAHRGSTRRLSVMRLSLVLAFLLLTGAATALSGCGTSNGTFITPAGTSTITLNATTGTATATTPQPAATLQIQLTVPPAQ
jgi:sugar lactone lactonase YvrE